MRIEMCNCQSIILAEIADPKMKRNDVSQTYAWCLRSSEPIDYAKINAAILARWSLHALQWIKERAWSGRCFTKMPGGSGGETPLERAEADAGVLTAVCEQLNIGDEPA